MSTATAALPPLAAPRSTTAASSGGEAAAKRFGESLGRQAAEQHAGAAQPPAEALPATATPPRSARKLQSTVVPGDAIASFPLPVPRHTREESNAALASPGMVKTAAAPRADATPSAGAPAQPNVEASVADRLALPPPGTSETQLTFHDARTPVRDVLVVQNPVGALSVDINLSRDQSHGTAATDELRRRLAARGVTVAAMSVRTDGSFG
ncbi:hypothetical protein EWE75_07100 [Sphingomonas populi]|uniref:Uncharacterized protein n=1 Tax=Sphingomonas populi TaxID=2484750 RepID=A0A4Q6XYQ3_9SPHN|nr:hypothetical protein [Sphingomonas populi]RZF65131.1 hypothetical protein EWE75_07100 [Sphingomonas populi]